MSKFRFSNMKICHFTPNYCCSFKILKQIRKFLIVKFNFCRILVIFQNVIKKIAKIRHHNPQRLKKPTRPTLLCGFVSKNYLTILGIFSLQQTDIQATKANTSSGRFCFTFFLFEGVTQNFTFFCSEYHFVQQGLTRLFFGQRLKSNVNFCYY